MAEKVEKIVFQSKGKDLGIYRMIIQDADGIVQEVIEDVFIQTDVVNGTKRLFKSVDGKMEELMIRRQHGLADDLDPARGGIRKGFDVIGGFDPLTGEQDIGGGVIPPDPGTDPQPYGWNAIPSVATLVFGGADTMTVRFDAKPGMVLDPDMEVKMSPVLPGSVEWVITKPAYNPNQMIFTIKLSVYDGSTNSAQITVSSAAEEGASPSDFTIPGAVAIS